MFFYAEENSEKVTKFYDELAEEGHSKEDRKTSAITDLRSFNNWIKAVQSSFFCRPFGKILLKLSFCRC